MVNAICRSAILVGFCFVLQACSTLSSSFVAVDDTLFPAQEQAVTVLHQNEERSAIALYPEGYTDMRRIPVIIDLHASGEDARSEMEMSGIREAAAERGYMAVFPEGLARGGVRGWNVGGCCGEAAAQGVDDAGFLSLLIDRLVADFKADPNRIYVTGFSNGASMALQLGCSLSHKIAGLAPVSGVMVTEGCRPVRPLPVILFHGAADNYVPYQGGTPSLLVPGDERQDNATSSVVDTVHFWVQRNGCFPEPERMERGGYIRERYMGAQSHAEVVVYTLPEGGHAWPGGDPSANYQDSPVEEVPAAWLILDFFSRHEDR